MVAATTGDDGRAANGVVWIDITSVGKPTTRAFLPLMYLRVFVLFIGTLLLALLWAVLVFVIIDRIGARGTLETISLIVGLPIAVGPFLYAGYWVFSRRIRWDAGTDPLLSRGNLSSAELARPVPHLNISLKDLIDWVNGFAAMLGKPVIVRETSRAKILLARSLQSAAWGGLAVGIVISVSSGGYWQAIMAAAVFPLLMLRANKALQPSLQALLAVDTRKPVLLLRSFRDEEIKGNQRFPTPIGDISLQRRFEQGIAGSLGALGPLIGVGKPGEDVPQIGASRAYLSDAEWQPAVLRWLDQSLLIVMIAGVTEWITWELHRVVEMGRSQRLLILMPPGTDKARWQHVVDSLAHTSWNAALRTIDTQGVLLVQLRYDGNVIAIRRQSAISFIQDYQLAMAIALYEEFGPKPQQT